jgi:hypothetical protein
MRPKGAGFMTGRSAPAHAGPPNRSVRSRNMRGKNKFSLHPLDYGC